MAAYYSENDPFAAQWLRELIKAGHIAPGEVDERSIEEVTPGDLRGYTQCHFFAGIGVWSYALRRAGWSDETPVWTGSCPCQSFSASGKGEGFSDKRHLWPTWFRLIRECRPDVCFGEQVASKDGLAWLDVVSADLEGEGYAIGAADMCAASCGAPHIRQRLFFVTHPSRERVRTAGLQCVDGSQEGMQGENGQRKRLRTDTRKYGATIIGANAKAAEVRTRSSDVRARSGSDEANGLGDGCGTGDLRDPEGRGLGVRGSPSGNSGRSALAGEAGDSLDTNCTRLCEGEQASATARQRSSAGSASGFIDSEHTEQPRLEGLAGNVREWRGPGWLDPITARSIAEAGATRGFWADCDWWYGRDRKYRPIGPGLFPLVTGASARVGRLRGFGNALNSETAKAFIEAWLEI